jgi:hypothetical protein
MKRNNAPESRLVTSPVSEFRTSIASSAVEPCAATTSVRNIASTFERALSWSIRYRDIPPPSVFASVSPR